MTKENWKNSESRHEKNERISDEQRRYAIVKKVGKRRIIIDTIKKTKKEMNRTLFIYSYSIVRYSHIYQFLIDIAVTA